MNSENQFTLKGIAIWLICALFFLYEFLLRTVIGTFQHPIMYDLDLSSFKFAILSTTTYLVVYGVTQIPIGIFVDRYGLKKSLFVAALLCAFATIGFSYAHNYGLAILFRMITALGSAFGFICLLAAVFEWLPNRHTALLIGVSQFIGTLGPMLAAGPIESMAHSSDQVWRQVFWVLGIFGVFIAALVYAFVENNKSTTTGGFVVLSRPNGFIDTLKSLIYQSAPWLIALFSGLVYFSIEYLSENEGKYFVTLKGHSPIFASYMITLAWIGYAIGCPFWGLLSDYYQRRRNVMITSAICYSVAITGIIYVNHAFLLSACFVLLGIGAGGHSVGFANIAEQFSRKLSTISFGLNNTVIMMVGSINAPMIGAIIDHFRSSGKLELLAYQHAFTVLIIISVIAIILPMFFIKETFCKSSVEFTYLNRERLS